MAVIIEGEEYLYSDEAAQLADVSQSAIQNWCRKGKVKSRQGLNGRWLVHRASLEEFIAGSSNHNPSDKQ